MAVPLFKKTTQSLVHLFMSSDALVETSATNNEPSSKINEDIE